MTFWAIEMLCDDGEWWPLGSLCTTKEWAERVMREEFERKNPSDKFRVTKYVREEPHA